MVGRIGGDGMKTKLEVIYGISPDNLGAKVNQFFANNDLKDTSIQFDHIVFDGKVSFYAYITYAEGESE